ncbi:unnamed protein product, partial [Effrenium voratum]
MTCPGRPDSPKASSPLPKSDAGEARASLKRASLKDQTPLVLPVVSPEEGSPVTPASRRTSVRLAESKPSSARSQAAGRLKPKAKARVAQISFDHFRRNKEREQQGAAVYDIRTARSGVLQSLRVGSIDQSLDAHFEDFPFFASSVPEVSEVQDPSLMSPGGADRSRPGTSGSTSRPGTRQLARQREAQMKLIEAKEDLELEEDNDETFISVAQREQLKQEYWQEYNEAGSAKKTLSEFEEWQRVLHCGKTEASTTAASDAEDGLMSRISVEDTEWRISHLGFTRRSDHEEYVSDYYRRCRERHYIPLGPRGTPRDRKGRSQPVMDPVTVEPGVMNFGGWSLGSERLEMLCQAPGAVEHCTRCDLSANRIEDRSVAIICEKLLPKAEALNLAQNFIGQKGIRDFEAALRKITVAPLLELNLQGNRLGTPFGASVVADAYERDLCNFVGALSTRAPELRALSLAQNGLGRVNHELGKVLGAMIGDLKFLRVLDLHWNSFNGLGAFKLLEGLYDNRAGGGRLSRVDLSWNRLGTGAKHCSPAKMLSDVLANNDNLFHLDISYNSMGIEDCSVIAAGLRRNHTLFGLHVAGNEAFVDELGFLVPLTDPRMRLAGNNVDLQAAENVLPEGAAWSVEEAARQLLGREVQHPSFPVVEQGGVAVCWDGRRGSVPPPPPTDRPELRRPARRKYPPEKHRTTSPKDKPWEEWEDKDHSLLLAQSFESANLESVALRAERCWICDRFQTVKIVWTPSISGRLEEDEVNCVHAYLSTDDFHRPTILRKAKSEGQATRFVGHRMVPKIKETLLVVFRVNAVIEVAHDMPVRFLPCPAKVCEVKEADLAHWEAEGSARDMLPQDANSETLWANELLVKERASPLVVTEDAVAEGKLEVHPRTVDKIEVSEVRVWDISGSMFASWRQPEKAMQDKMLGMDLKFCRIQKFAPDQDPRKVKQALLPHYRHLVAIYRKMCCWSEKHQVFGVSLHNVTALLRRSHAFDRAAQAEHLPSMAFAAHVVERKNAEEIKVFSESYLIRYQFVETLLRLAEAKYVKTNRAEDLGEAIAMLMTQHLEPEVQHLTEEAEQFQREVMTEEVECVFKSNLNLLNAAYNIYAGITEVPEQMPYVADQTSSKRKVTLPDLYELLDDCDAYDDRFLRRQTSRAFSLANMWQVDEVSTSRHMYLNFVEFLMALGAVVFLKDFYKPAEMADLLEEFLLDQLQPVVLDYRSRNGKGGQELLTHKTVRAVVKEVFKDVDEDANQALSIREFGRCLQDPRTQELLMNREFRIEDVLNVFGMLDTDASGELNFGEVVHGLGALLKVEQTEPRIRAFLRKELGNEDGRGHFTGVMLAEFLEKSTTHRKLMRVGINVQELTKLVLQILEVSQATRHFDRIKPALEVMLSEAASATDRKEAKREFTAVLTNMRKESQLYSANDFTEKLLRLRHPKPILRWKIVIKQIFEQADTDQCGSLTKEERYAFAYGTPMRPMQNQ